MCRGENIHSHMNHSDFDDRGVLDATLENGRWQVDTPHHDAGYRTSALPESGRLFHERLAAFKASGRRPLVVERHVRELER